MKANSAAKARKKPEHLAGKAGKDEVSTAAPVKKKMDTKIKKRLIVIAVVLALLAAAFFGLRACGAAAMQTGGLTLADTTVLKYGDIEDSFSTNGTVESARSVSVYSTLAYPVMSLDVEVGDYVTEGQLLCRLDGEALQEQIETQQAGKNDTAASTAQQVKSAQDTYNAAKSALENGENASIISAQSQVDSALTNYNKAVDAYDRYRSGMSEGTNSTLLGQEAALHSAKAAVESAQDSYNSALDDRTAAYNNWRDKDNQLSAERGKLNALYSKKSTIISLQNDISAELAQIAYLQQRIIDDPDNRELYESQIQVLRTSIASLEAQAAALGTLAAVETQIAQQETAISTLEASVSTLNSSYNSSINRVNAAATALSNARETYEIAKKQYTATVENVDYTLSDYATAVDTAYENYQTALASLQSAKTAAQNQLQSYLNALTSAQTGAATTVTDVNIRHLRADLSDTSITAPASGTVTAVYAKVGATGSGLLFVIEDVDELVVETEVKDYDVGGVFVGMPVSIKSDSTGDKLFDGAVSSVAPAAKKNALGETDAVAGAVYETEAQVLTADSGLKIGMSARLNFIVAQEKNVIAAPYEAVYENLEGKTCVMTASEQENGKYLLTEVEVVTGMENDLDIVISGAGVDAGVRILNDPTDYIGSSGKEITISQHQSAQQAMLDMMGG